MKELDRTLCKLLGDKTISFGCETEFGTVVSKYGDGLLDDTWWVSQDGKLVPGIIIRTENIIGHRATFTDLLKFVRAHEDVVRLGRTYILNYRGEAETEFIILGETGMVKKTIVMNFFHRTDSILDQSDDTKITILELIDTIISAK